MDEFAPYHAAVRWIHSNIRGPADGPPAEPGYPIDERIRRKFARLHSILAQLDHPERRFAPIHVAGTSGKGSTSALIASMTAAAGLRTALHVTPYLQTPLEKLLVNGRPMNVDRFAQLVNAFRPKVERFNAASTVGPLRYGELWVTLTLAAYAAERVDVGVVEVGRGGRYDATNVITPVVSVINRVGYDHVRSLGPTLRDIAGHKAGIIKAGVPAVVAEQEAEALDVIVGEARRQEAPVYLAGHDFFWRLRERAPSGSAFSYEDAAGRIDDLFVPLLGDFQVANAALAIAALRVARLGRAVDPVAIRSGVAGVRFPGRLERVQESPEVYLDGAHNGQKAEALAAALGQLAAGRRLVLVLGILASHNAHDIVAALAPHADAIVCTATNVIGKGATPPDDLAALCRPYCRHVEVEPGAARATARGIDLAGQAGVVCVTGSLYLVGEARARWHSEIDILRSAWRQDEDPLPDLVAAIS